jgi:hypothetical protein
MLLTPLRVEQDRSILRAGINPTAFLFYRGGAAEWQAVGPPPSVHQPHPEQQIVYSFECTQAITIAKADERASGS